MISRIGAEQLYEQQTLIQAACSSIKAGRDLNVTWGCESIPQSACECGLLYYPHIRHPMYMGHATRVPTHVFDLRTLKCMLQECHPINVWVYYSIGPSKSEKICIPSKVKQQGRTSKKAVIFVWQGCHILPLLQKEGTDALRPENHKQKNFIRECSAILVALPAIVQISLVITTVSIFIVFLTSHQRQIYFQDCQLTEKYREIKEQQCLTRNNLFQCRQVLVCKMQTAQTFVRQRQQNVGVESWQAQTPSMNSIMKLSSLNRMMYCFFKKYYVKSGNVRAAGLLFGSSSKKQKLNGIKTAMEYSRYLFRSQLAQISRFNDAQYHSQRRE